MVNTCTGIINVISQCIPNWQCRQPLDGYEHDINNCGIADRLNSACNPPPPPLQTAVAIVVKDSITGMGILGASVSIDGIGTVFSDQNGVAYFPVVYLQSYAISITKSGYNNYNSTISVTQTGSQIFDAYLTAPPPPCIPNWQCEPGQTGYETDGCGNRRLNSACNPPPQPTPPPGAIRITASNAPVGTVVCWYSVLLGRKILGTVTGWSYYNFCVTLDIPGGAVMLCDLTNIYLGACP